MNHPSLPKMTVVCPLLPLQVRKKWEEIGVWKSWGRRKFGGKGGGGGGSKHQKGGKTTERTDKKSRKDEEDKGWVAGIIDIKVCLMGPG